MAAPSIDRHFADEQLYRAMLEVCPAELGDYLSAAVGAAGTDPAAPLRACQRLLLVRARTPRHLPLTVRPDLDPQRRAGARIARWVASSRTGSSSSPTTYRRVESPPSLRRSPRCACGPRCHGLVTLRVSKPSFPWPPLEQLIDHTRATELGLRWPARSSSSSSAVTSLPDAAGAGPIRGRAGHACRVSPPGRCPARHDKGRARWCELEELELLEPDVP